MKTIGPNADKFGAGGEDEESDEEVTAFVRLLAARGGRPTSASGLNLQQMLPGGVRGQLIRQALGIGR